MLDFLKGLRTPRAAVSPTPVSLLFLDVDGVLNSQATRENGDHMPAPELLDNLASIVRTTSSKIVLSSTWRLEGHSRHAVEHALASRNIKLLDSTADLTCRGDRVDEVLAWMTDHPEYAVQAWIAVDDMDLIKMNSKLLAVNFVRTCDSVGLVTAKVTEAIRKLSAQQHLGSGAPSPSAHPRPGL